jgi:hypothetical protein
MRWSKVKLAMESLLAESLRGRVAYYATRYHHAHDSEGRGWITFDGKEVANFCTLSAWQRENELDGTRANMGSPRDHRTLVTARWAEGFYTLPEYQDTLREYLNMSIESALESGDPLTRALAILDRRLGKRRLRALGYLSKSHPLVTRFYEFRCFVENVAQPTR